MSSRTLEQPNADADVELYANGLDVEGISDPVDVLDPFLEPEPPSRAEIRDFGTKDVLKLAHSGGRVALSHEIGSASTDLASIYY